MFLAWLSLPSMCAVPYNPWAWQGISMSQEPLPTRHLYLAILPMNRLNSLEKGCSSWPQGHRVSLVPAQCANRDYGYAYALQPVLRGKGSCVLPYFGVHSTPAPILLRKRQIWIWGKGLIPPPHQMYPFCGIWGSEVLLNQVLTYYTVKV